MGTATTTHRMSKGRSGAEKKSAMGNPIPVVSWIDSRSSNPYSAIVRPFSVRGSPCALRCANMKNQDPAIIRVRYGPCPIVGILLIAFVAAVFSSPVGVVLILMISLPFLAALSNRPFLLVSANDARYVSLVSDQIFRSITFEELERRLPSMRWFLRKRDLALLANTTRFNLHMTALA